MNQTGSTAGHLNQQPFSSFLQNFKEKLHYLFHIRSDIDELSTRRGMPPFILREIMADNPLSTFVSEQYSGRGGLIHEGLSLLSAASYESLPLSLGFGINWALFLQPIGKYAPEETRQNILNNFLAQRKMGGLMITEPDYGSDALHMKTFYTEYENDYHLQGTKHWAGLTGWADYWLLTARRQTADGGLGRDIDFFICDVSQPEQNVTVEEFYENLGIYLLPYGRNRIDVRIPKAQKLEPKTTGIKMMLDLLHRSRMQFPGMGLGFLERMLDEAVSHCQQRNVGGRSLFSYDQVQHRLSQIQGATTIASAMCLNSSLKADLNVDLSAEGLEANCVKTYVTDLMQNTAQSLLQLVGAKGYRLNHIAGRAIVDSRPFQIFEGSNDILYIQIGEAIQKRMQKLKERNLFQTYKQLDLTSHAAERLKKLVDLTVQSNLSQRKLNDLGQLTSRISALNMLQKLGAANYAKELIDGAVCMVESEITTLLAGFQLESTVTFQEEKEAGWLDCFHKLQIF